MNYLEEGKMELKFDWNCYSHKEIAQECDEIKEDFTIMTSDNALFEREKKLLALDIIPLIKVSGDWKLIHSAETLASIVRLYQKDGMALKEFISISEDPITRSIREYTFGDDKKTTVLPVSVYVNQHIDIKFPDGGWCSGDHNSSDYFIAGIIKEIEKKTEEMNENIRNILNF